MSPDSEARGRALLAIARGAILEGAAAPHLREAWLAQPGASFVTLKLDGELRGCIGSLEAHRPLAEDVARNALAAAYRDPRFEPVSGEEKRRLAVEVSVLSPAEPIEFTSEEDAIAQLRPGIDGVVFEYAGLKSTFLPQVWESLPEPRDFLAQLKVKAGLPMRFWDPAVRLSRYGVEKYG